MIYIETGSTDVYYNFGLEYYFTLEKRLPETVFLFRRTTPTLMGCPGGLPQREFGFPLKGA